MSTNGNCEIIRNIQQHEANDGFNFDFPSEVVKNICTGHSTVLPIQTDSNDYTLTVVPSRDRPQMKLNSEQRMVQRWVECWLRARSRGDKEVAINDTMKAATENAFEAGIYGSESLKILKSHCSEGGRKRFLERNRAFIQPRKVSMPRGEPAYVFPFQESLSMQLENEAISKLLQYSSNPPLLHSIEAIGVNTIFILLHVDDIKLSNPLGSKRKRHSIRIFQWEIYNLPSWYKTKLEAKHPLAIAHASSFKFSKEKAWKTILYDFIQVLKKFQDGGFSVGSSNESKAVRLGSVLGDGLGIFEILGLTMSFGRHSKHACFRCDIAGGHKLNEECRPKDFTRTKEKILADCQKLRLASATSVRPNSRDQADLSYQYGIHFRCPFFYLEYVGIH